MVATIPFRISDNNYRLVVPFNNIPTIIDTRWSARDEAWYLDFRQEDETPIILGVKVVLGVNLGRQSTDPFFQSQMFVPFDTSGADIEAGFDDLGGRVIVQRLTIADLTGQ